MTDAATQPKARDRQRTAELLLAAAKQVLVSSGFQGFGVNAVARQAGCDKQLIYRYFGGLDGLVEAVGADLAATLEASLADAGSVASDQGYADMVEHLILALLETFRGSDLLARIAAWESADPTPLTRGLADARGRVLGRWIARVRGDRTPPPGIDAPMQNALLIAAVQQMVLAGRATGAFAGVGLEEDADWERVRDALRAMVRAAYAGPVPSP